MIKGINRSATTKRAIASNKKYDILFFLNDVQTKKSLTKKTTQTHMVIC